MNVALWIESLMREQTIDGSFMFVECVLLGKEIRVELAFNP